LVGRVFREKKFCENCRLKSTKSFRGKRGCERERKGGKERAKHEDLQEKIKTT
jgi:hypothetical protein